MGKTMIASEMTDGQIDNIANKLRDALRKHRSHISSEAAQTGSGIPNIGMELFSLFRTRAEATGNSIVRFVGRKKIRVFFFKVGRSVTMPELEKEYAARRLTPVNSEVLFDVKVDENLSPIFSSWRGEGGKWKYAYSDEDGAESGNRSPDTECAAHYWVAGTAEL